MASVRVLDATTSLNPPINWTNASGAVFSSLGGSQYLVTAPAQASFSFYRIVDLGSLDTDGDGVPDAVENALGTNPNVPDWIQDTDGDGYSDGLEIINGASPTNATSRILRGLQPEVQFVQTTSRAIEGVGTHSVPFAEGQVRGFPTPIRKSVLATVPGRWWMVPASRRVALPRQRRTGDGHQA